MELALLAKGLVVGFTVAAPVGPIGMLCIRRTILYGMANGIVSGLGAASADAVYGLIAAFGLTIIANFLLEQQYWLRVLGGLFLCYLSYRSFTVPVVESGASDHRRSLAEAYVSTFLLTISSPITIFAFIAVFAGGGLGIKQRDFLSAGFLVLGVFTGSALWWLILARIVGKLKMQFDSLQLSRMNKLVGILLGIFGVTAMLSVL